MSQIDQRQENKFRECYAAALFAQDATMRRFIDKLTINNIVLMDDIVTYSADDFFSKYNPPPQTKKALLKGLRQMRLSFAD